MEQHEFYVRLGKKLQQIRSEDIGISQEEFANRVGLSRPSIVNIEKGRQQVSCHQLVVFASELNTDPCILLGCTIDEESRAAKTQISSKQVPEELRDWFERAK